MSGKVVNIIPSREASTLRKKMDAAHTRARMTPPHKDGDPRLSSVFDSLTKTWMSNEGITAEFVPEFDYRLLINPAGYKNMSFFQVRENNTLTERIEKNRVRFFGQVPEALQKAPIIFKYVEDGETTYAPIVGNGRGYCFKAENSQNSFQPAIVFEFPPETDLVDVFEAALDAASKSNTTLSSDIDPEKSGDVVQQLRSKYRTLKMRNEKVTKEECVPTLLAMLMKKPDYSKEEQSSYRSKLVNEALQLGQSEPTPAPTDDEVDEQWSKFFGVDFNLKSTTNVEKECGKGFPTDIEMSLYRKWKTAPDQQKPAWLVARVGAQSGHAVTSIQAVNLRRKQMLKHFADMNTNPKRVKGAHQLITRVMFQKQLTDSSNKCVAFEWCPDAEEFIDKKG